MFHFQVIMSCKTQLVTFKKKKKTGVGGDKKHAGFYFLN